MEELPQQCKEYAIVPIYKREIKVTVVIVQTTYKILSSFLISRLTLYIDKIIGYHKHEF